MPELGTTTAQSSVFVRTSIPTLYGSVQELNMSTLGN